MKGFLVFCTLLATGLALTMDTNDLWTKFKTTHKKVYNKVEELKRKSIFVKNLQLILKHNAEADLGYHKFRLGLNKFADLENHEYRRLTGYRYKAHARKADAVHTAKDVSDLPKEVDWRDKNLVVDVKDQGQCGSCWAFSAVGSLEGQHAKKTGKLISLSEQQLVDCSNPDKDPNGNQGCNGGLMNLAYDYLIKVGGIESEEDYPYTASDDECKFDKSKIAATIKGYVNVTVGDEKALQDAVANVGPVAVAIDAGSIWFQLYFGGVYDHDDCGNEVENLNHGVTAVGYGTEDGTDYWLVKNSWGGSWGSSGYIKMRRNGNNQCGIATDASYPLV